MDVTKFANGKDPFSGNGDDMSKIHLRVQQRNGRKCITIIQGLESDLDLERITRALRRAFKCNGSVQQDEEHGLIIQLSGDQRTTTRSFFLQEKIATDDQIVMHGG